MMARSTLEVISAWGDRGSSGDFPVSIGVPIEELPPLLSAHTWSSCTQAHLFLDRNAVHTSRFVSQLH
jgi:hypothetical protein